ncbi:MAG TPA: SCO family protein [Vitreimonas sp.]|uniref:SCO family protein n=1 Tax=Vitreimonas sp. TaxID=3069702 RepID=UPI002D2ABAAF|nr:SCO family protein [Vitreimonas sp.]HYD88440.1 SCO family protein [Vitreimonas sp.]
MAEPVETPRRNLTGAIVPALAAAGLAALAALVLAGRNSEEKTAQAGNLGPCIIEHADAVGGPIELLDSNGARVTQADFAGQPAVIYFGFTHCPDVCPTTMYAVGEALARDDSYDVQPILITVDPERDTPAVMGAYVRTGGFPAGLVGLSGSPAQIDAAVRAFRVYASRADIPGAPEGTYNVDHSSFLYVMDAQWNTVAIMPTMSRADPNDPRSPMVAAPVEQISACIAAGLERAAS